MLSFKRRNDVTNDQVGLLPESGMEFGITETARGVWSLDLRDVSSERPVDLFHDGFKCPGTYVDAAKTAVRMLSDHARKQVGMYSSALRELSPVEPGRFVAVMKSSAARDTQFAVVPDADPADDGAWRDEPEAQPYLGIYSGTRDQCLADAARYADVDPANVRLIPV